MPDETVPEDLPAGPQPQEMKGPERGPERPAPQIPEGVTPGEWNTVQAARREAERQKEAGEEVKLSSAIEEILEGGPSASKSLNEFYAGLSDDEKLKAHRVRSEEDLIKRAEELHIRTEGLSPEEIKERILGKTPKLYSDYVTPAERLLDKGITGREDLLEFAEKTGSDPDEAAWLMLWMPTISGGSAEQLPIDGPPGGGPPGGEGVGRPDFRAQEAAGRSYLERIQQITEARNPYEVRKIADWFIAALEHDKGAMDEWTLKYLPGTLRSHLDYLDAMTDKDSNPIRPIRVLEEPSVPILNGEGYVEGYTRPKYHELTQEEIEALRYEFWRIEEVIQAIGNLKTQAEIFESVAGSRTNIAPQFTNWRYVNWNAGEIDILFNLPETREGEKTIGRRQQEAFMAYVGIGLRDAPVHEFDKEDYERRARAYYQRKGEKKSDEEIKKEAEEAKRKEDGLTKDDYKSIVDEDGNRVLTDEQIGKIIKLAEELAKETGRKNRNILTWRQYQQSSEKGGPELNEQQVLAIEAKIAEKGIYKDQLQQMLETNPWMRAEFPPEVKGWLLEEGVTLDRRLGNIFAHVPKSGRLNEIRRQVIRFIEEGTENIPLPDIAEEERKKREAERKKEEYKPSRVPKRVLEKLVAERRIWHLFKMLGMSAYFALREDGTVNDDPTTASELSHIVWPKNFTKAKTEQGDWQGPPETLEDRLNFIVGPFLSHIVVYAKPEDGTWDFEDIDKANPARMKMVNKSTDVRNFYELLVHEGIELGDLPWNHINELEWRGWMLAVFFAARPSEGGFPVSVYEGIITELLAKPETITSKHFQDWNKALRLSIGLHTVAGISLQDWFRRHKGKGEDGRNLTFGDLDKLVEPTRQHLKKVFVKGLIGNILRQIEGKKEQANTLKRLYDIVVNFPFNEREMIDVITEASGDREKARDWTRRLNEMARKKGKQFEQPATSDL